MASALDMRGKPHGDVPHFPIPSQRLSHPLEVREVLATRRSGSKNQSSLTPYNRTVKKEQASDFHLANASSALYSKASEQKRFGDSIFLAEAI